MKIKIVSDLHLEHCPYHFDNVKDSADVLILAGDIIQLQTHTHTYITFLNRMALNYKMVFVIYGNHEYYFGNINGDYDRGSLEKKAGLKLASNVILMDNAFYDFEGVRFIGSILWTDFHTNDYFAKNAARNFMQDYTYIMGEKGFITPNDTYDLFVKNWAFLQANLSDNNVVITHHLPSYNSVGEKFKTSNNQDINYSFYSDLTNFIFDNTDKIKAWVHGHSHDFNDYEIGNTRIVCNPRGYSAFKKSMVPQLDNTEYVSSDEEYHSLIKCQNKNFKTNFIIEV